MLDKYIQDDEIFISKKAWKKLNIKYTQQEIIESFIDIILDKKLKIPYRHINRQEAKQDFLRLLEYDTSQMIKHNETFTRYDYDYKISNLYLAPNINIGNKASDFFQQKNRFKSDSINAPSPYRTWHTEKFLRTLLPALWTLKCQEVNSSVLRTIISLRKYIASQFRPVVAKTIYNKFDSKVVLDFSAGWGDRLCGFYASPNTRFYLGVDPNSRTCEKYYEQDKFYKKILKQNDIHKKSTYFINSPAEDLDFYSKNYFDTIFTSPPYFQVERYTQEDNQSWKRYKKLDDWKENFLFTTLEKVWYSLKRGGYLVLNISDVYCNHTINHICDDMNDFIINELGSRKFKAIGMAMSKRPNSGALKDKTGVFVEPVWIHKK